MAYNSVDIPFSFIFFTGVISDDTNISKHMLYSWLLKLGEELPMRSVPWAASIVLASI